MQSLLTPNSLSLSALLTIIDNIDLENNNSLKHAISSDDRLSLLLYSSSGITRAPSSSGYAAANSASHASKSLLQAAAAANVDDDQDYRRLPTTTTTNAASTSSSWSSSIAYRPRDSNRKIRVNRMRVQPECLPTPDELRLVRTKKRLIQQSVDLFNQSPSKSIQFLKDNSIFSNEPDIFMRQLIRYLKETPNLDKKVCVLFNPKS